MILENGYEMKSTFWSDFSISEIFGIKSVRETFNRVFKEWRNDYIYLTELSIVLNHKIWQHYKSNEELAIMYNKLWEIVDIYANETLEGDEIKHYLQITD